MMLELKNHRQLSQLSCAASGMEAVLKLHGLIDGDSFPFQTEFRDHEIGFTKLDRLKEYGVHGPEANWFSLDDALKRVCDETMQGRFPLISLSVQTDKGQTGWHIYVAARDGTELVLVNPGAESGKKICARSAAQVRLEFQRTLDVDLNRKGIEIATYSEVNADKSDSGK